MRRTFGVGSVARAAKGVSLDSLLALLEVASASPTACHRLASLALIFDSVLKRTKTGPSQATPDLLPKLAKAAHWENRTIRRLEDFIPHDARLGGGGSLGWGTCTGCCPDLLTSRWGWLGTFACSPMWLILFWLNMWNSGWQMWWSWC